MNLQEQLMEDMKTAMRARDAERLGVIRLIRSEVKNFEIDHGVADDAAVVKIIKKMLNQQLDALEDFKKAAREDLINETESIVKILQSYLPEQMSDQELEKFIQDFVEQSAVKDFGPLMGKLTQALGSKADGSRIASTLKKLLNK
ncbi:GatB/YqeY domain-containing protein [Candidatus Woesebacteria bacterium]|jgi:hypothetical protein|nr:GatB/YqeY domain-containing protein [Candidatus Woesebacteria bacterium]HNV44951.1 GatB/YqeY domain-containing protein [Candidatus Woesebacteria bacterium]HOA11684.1 GatB/YqeY domain-containing protein [Candidatus Woesebacteria bacterium]HOI05104.1 GatB/YqeY domain-containing protein [Candidatus Woesebacteria bacterium]HOP38794.1 GatB/YqeY domain-containing protein [Candidatus Woesebacteria bacterium]